MKHLSRLLLLLVVCSAVPSVAGATVPASEPTPNTSPIAVPSDPHVQRSSAPASALAAADGNIHVAYRVHLLPDDPEQVRVTATLSIPNRVSRITVILPSKANVVRSSGFDKSDGEREYEWNGGRANPSLTYDIDPDRRSESVGGLNSVDAGAWALVSTESVGFDRWYYWWTFGDEPGVSTSMTVSNEGVGGSTMSYLGPATTYSRSVDRQTIRLVVPERASVDHDAVFRSLDATSRLLRVGDRDSPVTVIVATDPIRRGGLFIHSSEFARRSPAVSEDMWVHEDSEVGGPRSVWIHEYVHTRQAYIPSQRMAWIDEGIAEYYGALFPLYSGDSAFETFHRLVTSEKGSDAVLLREGEGPDQYSKGSRVVASLDAMIHRETTGERSFQDVFARMNRHEGVVTYEVFVDIVSDVAGTRLDDWLDRYVAGDEAPSVPDDPALYTPAGRSDVDADGLTDDREADAGTSPFDPDTDGDGLDDHREVAELDTDPVASDTDGDGLEDGVELATHSTDPTGRDTDDDGLDDGREVAVDADPLATDTDGDGLSDGKEVDDFETDPDDVDTDDDGLDDDFEARTEGMSPTDDDSDGDTLQDGRERNDLRTDPTVADTDGDGLSDGVEVDDLETDPTVADTDDDGLSDGTEVDDLGTDPTVADTDGDGLVDGREVDDLRADPLDEDTDDDGLSDGYELREAGTDLLSRDSDGDGYMDREELDVGTDPTSKTDGLTYWLTRLLGAFG